MKRVPRPKLSRTVFTCVAFVLPALVPLGTRAQLPVSSTYATRDGRIASSVIGCASTDNSFTAQPCGVAGYPLHVQVDAAAGGTPTTAPGTASGQVVGVQGGGAGALPVAVSQSGVWTLALPSGAHVALDSGGNVIGGVVQSGAWSVSVSNLPATQVVSGSVSVSNLPALNGDGGALVHVTNAAATQAVTGTVSVSNLPATQAVSGSVAVSNLPATQAVSAASLPLPTGAATAANQPVVNTDGGGQVHVMNLPTTQAVSGSVSVSNLPATQAISAASLPLPTGAATAANQAPVNTDGGGQVHVMNLPATQAVSGSVSISNLPATQAVSAASLPLPAGAATAANQAAINVDGGTQIHLVNPLPAGANTIGTVVEANRSGAWTDASVTAIATAAVPSGLAAVAARTGLHVWNLGTATACLNYTAAAAASGSGCAAGSVPIPAGSAYLEDQPGNVSPEAISLVCAAAACPLTIKVR